MVAVNHHLMDDEELRSVFEIEDDDSDSDEEYFPWSSSGKILQEVEAPYDMGVRIQQANRELFSQPVLRKNKISRVKFDLVPKVIELNAAGDVSEQNIEESDRQGKKAAYRRRQTPVNPVAPQVTSPGPPDNMRIIRYNFKDKPDKPTR